MLGCKVRFTQRAAAWQFVLIFMMAPATSTTGETTRRIQMQPTKLAITLRLLRMLGYRALPDLSNLMGIAKLRYIQSIFEPPEWRNPDTLIGDFLPSPIRWLSLMQGKIELSKLRSRPFYYYLIARTKYYDQIFTNAIRANIRYIINIGSGTDTRAYRFSNDLASRNTKVFECDQEELIAAKRKLVKRRRDADQVTYIPIDINSESWSELDLLFSQIQRPVLVMLEGVSPYIREDSFDRFLRFIADKTVRGSRVTYDYQKARGADERDKAADTKRLFRLPASRGEIIWHHEALGYGIEHLELSHELTSRLLLDLPREFASFMEDGLLQLTVTRGKADA
jgi:methyltransferase (TIGR00027 family)